jgi:hypothetical protein
MGSIAKTKEATSSQIFAILEKHFASLVKYFPTWKNIFSHPPVTRLELIHPTKASDEN